MLHDFISLADLTEDEILELLALADDLKHKQHAREPHEILAGQSIALIFEKPSLRTRVSFEAGIYQLGGQSIMIHSEHSRMGERESVPDVARNLERWVDAVMARTFSHTAVEQLAEHASIPVINGLTDRLHPCQVLADLQTLREHKGGQLTSLKVAFVGDGNNVCASWLQAAARLPFNFAHVGPPGYEPDPEAVLLARNEGKGEIIVTRDLEVGMKDADAVYTDVWASMGQEDEQAERIAVFKPYQINSKVMSMAKPDALFMHCLPAKRGKEVTDDVIDSDQSVVFDQAENRLHTQKAVMVKLMQRGEDGLCPKRRARAERVAVK